MAQVADQDFVGIIESAAAGDQIAFGRIVAAYHDEMCPGCAYISGDDQLGPLGHPR